MAPIRKTWRSMEDWKPRKIGVKEFAPWAAKDVHGLIDEETNCVSTRLKDVIDSDIRSCSHAIDMDQSRWEKWTMIHLWLQESVPRLGTVQRALERPNHKI